MWMWTCSFKLRKLPPLLLVKGVNWHRISCRPVLAVPGTSQFYVASGLSLQLTDHVCRIVVKNRKSYPFLHVVNVMKGCILTQSFPEPNSVLLLPKPSQYSLLSIPNQIFLMP